MEDLKLLIASNEPDIPMLTEVIPKRQVNPIEESQITDMYGTLTSTFQITILVHQGSGEQQFLLKMNLKAEK